MTREYQSPARGTVAPFEANSTMGSYSPTAVSIAPDATNSTRILGALICKIQQKLTDDTDGAAYCEDANHFKISISIINLVLSSYCEYMHNILP